MEPSTVDKMKMGAAMGGTVGLCIGFVFGSISLIRFGPGNSNPITLLSKYMLGYAASFGLFMSVGTVVRSENRLPMSAYERRLPVIMKQRDNQ
ncbi:unnamed protein product [Rhizopus microsporus]